MEYYLTITTYQISPLYEEEKIMQLVKASNKENAKKAVENSIDDCDGKAFVIFKIEVYDTLIGE